MIATLAYHHYPHGVTVYNFEVDGDHTYFVGTANGGVWVHNNCTETAQALKDAGNPGEIYRLELDLAKAPPAALWLGDGNTWEFHDVLYDAEENVVRDPMSFDHSDPVPFNTWAQKFPYWDEYKWGPKP